MIAPYGKLSVHIKRVTEHPDLKGSDLYRVWFSVCGTYTMAGVLSDFPQDL
jgi:hypothetical protein